MPQQFLYEQLDSVSKMGFLKKEIPGFVAENLNSSFELREYQKEAFGGFFHCYNSEYENKEYPLHFLFIAFYFWLIKPARKLHTSFSWSQRENI